MAVPGPTEDPNQPGKMWVVLEEDNRDGLGLPIILACGENIGQIQSKGSLETEEESIQFYNLQNKFIYEGQIYIDLSI